MFLFEGNASYGLADYLGIQALLKQNNRRSCIWDKPGLGYSDYLLTEMKDYSTMYTNLINSIGETGPFAFVGWGAGGSILYEYANKNPSVFKSLTFLDASPTGIEFTIPATLKGWTDAQLKENKNKEYTSRKIWFNSVNGIGVPFGLIKSFFTSSPFSSNEVNWNFQTEKTWITQEYFLPNIKDSKNVFETVKINDSIPINVIMTVKTDDQIKNQVCKKNDFAFDSAECKYEIDSNNLSIKLRANLFSLGKAGTIFNCTSDECDLGYYVGKGAEYTVDKLLKI